MQYYLCSSREQNLVELKYGRYDCPLQGFHFYAHPVLSTSAANVKKNICSLSGIAYAKQGTVQSWLDVSSPSIVSSSTNFSRGTPQLVPMALLSKALILAYALPILTVCSSLGGKIYAYICT